MENDSRVANVGQEDASGGPKGGESDRIKVCVRLRPPNGRERSRAVQQEELSYWQVGSDDAELCESGGASERGKSWRFDRVFDEGTTTMGVYGETMSHLVENVLSGVHGTALVYGQTSSGKTHTMFGSGSQELGAVQLALTDLFDRIKATPGRTFTLEMSFVEVYNEVIGDLLDDGLTKRSGLSLRPQIQRGALPKSRQVNIREDSKGEITLTAQRRKITCLEDAIKVLSEGSQRKQIGTTSMNDRSSRSHTILTVHVTSVDHNDHVQRKAHLNLVDLAGSESMRTSHASGSQVQEAKNINQSLLALALVISTLADSKCRAKASFRNSKLTRILKPALTGRSLVVLICCITPAQQNMEETKSTLQFARTARQIPVHAVANESIAPEIMVARLQKELEQIKIQGTPGKDRAKQIDDREIHFAESIKTLEAKSASQRKKLQHKLAGLMHLVIENTPMQAPRTRTPPPVFSSPHKPRSDKPIRRRSLHAIGQHTKDDKFSDHIVALHNRVLQEKLHKLELELQNEQRRSRATIQCLRSSLRNQQCVSQALQRERMHIDDSLSENVDAIQELRIEWAIRETELKREIRALQEKVVGEETLQAKTRRAEARLYKLERSILKRKKTEKKLHEEKADLANLVGALHLERVKRMETLRARERSLHANQVALAALQRKCHKRAKSDEREMPRAASPSFVDTHELRAAVALGTSCVSSPPSTACKPTKRGRTVQDKGTTTQNFFSTNEIGVDTVSLRQTADCGTDPWKHAATNTVESGTNTCSPPLTVETGTDAHELDYDGFTKPRSRSQVSRLSALATCTSLLSPKTRFPYTERTAPSRAEASVPCNPSANTNDESPHSVSSFASFGTTATGHTFFSAGDGPETLGPDTLESPASFKSCESPTPSFTPDGSPGKKRLTSTLLNGQPRHERSLLGHTFRVRQFRPGPSFGFRRVEGPIASSSKESQPGAEPLLEEVDEEARQHQNRPLLSTFSPPLHRASSKTNLLTRRASLPERVIRHDAQSR